MHIIRVQLQPFNVSAVCFQACQQHVPSTCTSSLRRLGDLPDIASLAELRWTCQCG